MNCSYYQDSRYVNMWSMQLLIKTHYVSCLNTCYRKLRKLCTSNRTFTNTPIKNSNKWRIIFYGTDDLSIATLEALNLNRLSSDAERVVETLDVVCIKTSCPVQKYSEASNLKIHYWPYAIPEGQYDVGIVVSFGHLILTKCVLACKYGMINAHPSLLPRWRGAAPIIYSILHGDKETGVTILQVAPKKFDVGNILAQQKYIIPPNFTSMELLDVLAPLAAEMVLKTLADLPNALAASRPQSTTDVTLARKVKPEMGNVDWECSSVYDVDRKFRAYTGTIKLFTYFKKEKILLLNFLNLDEVIEAKIETLVSEKVEPGYCYFHKKRKILYVKCKDGWIGITSLGIPKSGKISATDFYNGFISKVEGNKCYFTKQPCN